MSQRQRLDAAYRATTYRVAAPEGPIDLRVGARSAPLAALLQARGASCWAYLAAVNPASQPLPPADNAVRHAALQAVLEQGGYPILAGEAIADAGDWPVEPGFLACGLGHDEAAALARRFGQNAFLWGEGDGPVTLVWVTTTT